MNTLYERLGADAAVEAAVVRFYERVMSDASVAHFFDGLDMDAQIAKQVAFMTMAFGGPNKYTGRDLRTAHARLKNQGLGDAHFDAVVGHLEATLLDLNIERSLIDEVLAIVAPTRKDVLVR